MDNKRLTRSNDRIIGGVCAGIAEYFDIDPTVVRVVYALITLIGVGLILYPALLIIIPSENTMDNKRLTRSNNRILGGVCAGIAEYLDIDSTVVRIGYVVLTLCTMFFMFCGVILYPVLWIIIPPKY